MFILKNQKIKKIKNVYFFTVSIKTFITAFYSFKHSFVIVFFLFKVKYCKVKFCRTVIFDVFLFLNFFS